MRILVTGGLGYIGSHTVVSLLKTGHEVVIVDDLSNSQISVLAKIKSITSIAVPFFQINITNKIPLENVFQNYSFDGIIHFAGYKSVGDSVSNPLAYYFNNLVTTMNIAEMCLKYKVNHFVFSSSATVYGDGLSPLNESMPLLKRSNPYGETKAICEMILSDTVNANPDFCVTLLRYFNPIGADSSGLIGEVPNGVPNNLMPYITQVANGIRKELSIYGNDYPTKDGTGVRDYIHVVDLALGHIAAIDNQKKGISVYNLGTGKGTSVLQLVHAFENENGVTIPYTIVGRRAGDIATCFADVAKAKRELNWEAKLTINDMVRDSWRFEKNRKQLK